MKPHLLGDPLRHAASLFGCGTGSIHEPCTCPNVYGLPGPKNGERSNNVRTSEEENCRVVRSRRLEGHLTLTEQPVVRRSFH